LEDGRSKDNEVPRGVWQTVETNIGKVGVGKAKGGGSKERRREEMRGERQEKETKKGKNNGGEESGQRVGNLG